MMFYLSIATLRGIWPHANTELIAGVSRESTPTLHQFGIGTIPDVVDFICEISEETGGMITLVEDLNYSAERAHEVWDNHFPTVASAAPFAGNPKALADKVYGGILGNRPGTDDGWNFRGRGPIQLTGRAWYEKIGKAIGFDLVNNPNAAADPRYCLQCAAAFWQIDGVNALANAGEFNAEVKRINGGYTNMAQRLAWRRIIAAHLTAATLAIPVTAGAQDRVGATSKFDAEVIKAPVPSSGATSGAAGSRPSATSASPAQVKVQELADRMNASSGHPQHATLLQEVEDTINRWTKGWGLG